MDRAQTEAAAMSAFVDRIVRLTRHELKAVIIVNAFIGICWMCVSPSRTQGGVYDPAKWLLSWQPVYPLRVWGALFLLLALLVLLARLFHDSKALRRMLLLLGAVWVWWMAVYTIAFLSGDGTGINIALAYGFARRHFVVADVQPWLLKG